MTALRLEVLYRPSWRPPEPLPLRPPQSDLKRVDTPVNDKNPETAPLTPGTPATAATVTEASAIPTPMIALAATPTEAPVATVVAPAESAAIAAEPTWVVARGGEAPEVLDPAVAADPLWATVPSWRLPCPVAEAVGPPPADAAALLDVAAEPDPENPALALDGAASPADAAPVAATEQLLAAPRVPFDIPRLTFVLACMAPLTPRTGGP